MISEHVQDDEDWLLEEFRQARREWAELPDWAKPVYVPGQPVKASGEKT